MASVGGSGELYLYSRLREIFREKVRSGEWPAEQPIPSERDLAGRYGVSRMTVRQAILELGVGAESIHDGVHVVFGLVDTEFMDIGRP